MADVPPRVLTPNLYFSANVDGNELEVIVGLSFTWDIADYGPIGPGRFRPTEAQTEIANAYWAEYGLRLDDAMERVIYGEAARALERRLLPALLPVRDVIEKLIAQQRRSSARPMVTAPGRALSRSTAGGRPSACRLSTPRRNQSAADPPLTRQHTEIRAWRHQ